MTLDTTYIKYVLMFLFLLFMFLIQMSIRYCWPHDNAIIGFWYSAEGERRKRKAPILGFTVIFWRRPWHWHKTSFFCLLASSNAMFISIFSVRTSKSTYHPIPLSLMCIFYEKIEIPNSKPVGLCPGGGTPVFAVGMEAPRFWVNFSGLPRSHWVRYCRYNSRPGIGQPLHHCVSQRPVSLSLWQVIIKMWQA